MKGYQGRWKGISPQVSREPALTGVPLETLDRITRVVTQVPEKFTIHAKAKVARMLEARAKEMRERRPVDWGFAETLAFGSLLMEGIPIRLSGQDCRRGTFSQRHAVWYDFKSGQPYTPLAHLDPSQGTFSIYDSLLSEAAVLGFEYGYSLDMPETLVLWEAQFGDFANGAQVIIDQFLVCGTSKWQRDSGLVLLLPHGYEGQGPEHSSGRLERFLQLGAEDNIQVCNPSTPAQYFHLLRRQMHRDFRKPLIVMTPKSLLRHKAAVSPLDDLTSDLFHEVLDDAGAEPSRIRRVVLCSGKIYYDLIEQRGKEDNNVALVRVEQLYPFAAEQIRNAIKRYPKAREIIWAQEESLNMGAWTFMDARLRALGINLREIRGPRCQRQPSHGLPPNPFRCEQEGRSWKLRREAGPGAACMSPLCAAGAEQVAAFSDVGGVRKTVASAGRAEESAGIIIMPIDIKVPSVGESVSEGSIARWLRKRRRPACGSMTTDSSSWRPEKASARSLPDAGGRCRCTLKSPKATPRGHRARSSG